MGRTLRVYRTDANADFMQVHHFRNFGERVWSALREEYSVSMEEIDASTREFHIREIPKRKVRTVAATVRKLAERDASLGIEVEEIKGGDDA